jgi:hypothetical protein
MRTLYNIKQILKIKGKKPGTRFIWLTITSSTKWHWCSFVCINGGDLLTSRETYIFLSGFYTMDSVGSDVMWTPWRMRLKVIWLQPSTLNYLFVFYAKVGGNLPVLKLHFCGTRYWSLNVLYYSNPDILYGTNKPSHAK